MIVKTKTEIVRARVNPQTKIAAEKVLNKLGLTMSEAINILLIQIKLKKGLPFDVRIPNKETLEALEETDKNKGLVYCKDLDDLHRQLGI